MRIGKSIRLRNKQRGYLSAALGVVLRGAVVRPSFDLPLLSSLIPRLAVGSGTPTFTRATAAAHTDHEGVIRQVLAGEARFQGARRVRNLIGGSSEDMSNVGWVAQGGLTKTATTLTFVNTTSYVQNNSTSGHAAGDTFVASMILSAPTTQSLQIALVDATDGNPIVATTITIGSISKRYGVSATLGATFGGSLALQILGAGIITAGTVVTISNVLVENVTGQTNKAPAEYVSKGVLSAPYHGAGVDGVKYFETLNGNTVASNVVTEAIGAAISSTTCKFAQLPGVAGSYFSTPDSVANSITGDIDVRVYARLDDWTPAIDNSLLGKWDFAGSKRAYRFTVLTTGMLQFNTSGDGMAVLTNASSVATGVADGTAKWVRATLDLDDGAGNRVAKFYLSDDAVTWTQLGTTITTAGVASIHDNTAPLEGGAVGLGTTQPLTGRIYRAQVYNGINGTLVVDFNPNAWTSGTTWTSTTGEVWTINGTASVYSGLWDASGPYGYIAEGARTNLCLRSQEFDNATWTKDTGVTGISANSTVAPDGTTTADTVTLAAGIGAHWLYQGVVLGIPGSTVSIFAKAGTASWISVAYGSNPTLTGAYFNLSTGVLGTINGAGFTARITRFPNGWYRCEVSCNTERVFMSVAVHSADNQAHTWNAAGTETVFLWGAQGETVVQFASSYIPTTTAAVTRNVDVLTYLAAGNIIGAVGSSYAEFVTPVLGSRRLLACGSTASSGPAPLYLGSSNCFSIFDGTTDPFTAGLVVVNSLMKHATSWGPLGTAMTGTGAVVATAAFDCDMNVGTNLTLDSNATHFGTFRNIKIYPRSLTAAQLQAMTT